MREDVERYIEARAVLGYKDRGLKYKLRNYAKFVEGIGAKHITCENVDFWLDQFPNAKARAEHKWPVAGLARFLRAEDPRHERVDDQYQDRRNLGPRFLPFIYKPREIKQVIDAFPVVRHRDDPQMTVTMQTIIGLLAASGMRLGEALRLRLEDYDGDRLTVHNSKFDRSRHVYLDPTTINRLATYISRRPNKLDSPAFFVSSHNRPPAKPTMQMHFRRCTDHLRMYGRAGSGAPRIHDLRHTFAVRSLAQCAETEQAVENHIVALSTHLGHVSVESTYYYLRLLPGLSHELASHLAGARHEQK